MAYQTLGGLPITEELAAKVSDLLSSRNIPNALWGNFLLTVYGIPSLSNDVGFVVPDDKVATAQKIISKNTDLDICQDLDCIISRPGGHPKPMAHFHLQQEGLHISLYLQSRAVPNVSDMTDSGTHFISASDPCLPKYQLGYGRGALSSKYRSVRIPSPTCFTEACLMNFVLASQADSPFRSHDCYYLNWMTYMLEYVHLRGYFDLSALPERSREFLDDVLLKGTCSVSAGRERLIASAI